MDNLNNICQNSNILTVFLILKYTLSIVCTVIPIIVIYSAISPAFKGVLKPDEVKKMIGPIIRSLIAGLIIFFLPSLFSFIFTDLVGQKDQMISNCFANASIENINRLREKEAQERKEAQEEDNKKSAEELKKQKEEQAKKNEVLKQEREEKEQQKANQSQNNSTSNNSSGSGNNAYGDLFVGDSRTVGFKSQINLKSTDSVYATSGGAMTAFNSDVSQAISKINSDPNHRYNLVLNYGVNNTTQDWVTAYKNIINQVNGKANILIVSVNPCNDNIAKYCRNSNIEVLNNKLKSAFSSGYSNVKYCDTYTPFVNTPNYTSMIETNEGIHYTQKGAEFIYNKINSCLSSF